MPEFFFEIGTEEIPARYVEPALDYMVRNLSEFFSKNRIKFGEHRTFATPRRLAVAFADVDDRQQDIVETFYGPSVQAAYDDQGNLTKAAVGFARSKGADTSAISRETSPKGEVICVRVEKKGQSTDALLTPFLSKLIGEIPFPKKMRWGSKTLAFARPLHWIAALFGGKTLAVEIDGIRSHNTSYGHRFLKPEPFQFDNLAGYLDQCEKHFLAVDPQDRKQRIQEQIKSLAVEVGGTVPDDPELLDEVNYLVEYPVGLRCDFDPKYLSLPKELLVITMRHHQKYFPMDNGDGKLLPHFIAISNMKTEKSGEIKRGNERVLRARLEDGRFFFDEDRKQKLEDYVERLQGVVFQKNLGTSYEKVVRIGALAKMLANNLCPHVAAKAERAARLCKADLVTHMVYEFPELQGIIGGYYALHSGENPDVALAIKEHYNPAFAGDTPPSNEIGAIVAISDKLDTILGCIGVGLIPSGSEDPYGLRRHSLGIIQIVLSRRWQISLDQMIETGIGLLSTKTKLKPEEIRTHTLDLFTQRLKSLFSSEGFSYDAVEAVLATGIDSFVDVQYKVIAFSELKQQPYFEPLAITFRRVVSILTEEARGEVQPELFQEQAEKDLFRQYRQIRVPVERYIEMKEYGDALKAIVEIKEAVDRFFDKVMVMVEDASLRKNRLHLLYSVSCLFSQLADFSKIVIKKS